MMILSYTNLTDVVDDDDDDDDNDDGVKFLVLRYRLMYKLTIDN